MCYSEPLSRDDSAFMTDHGWVLQGWKLCLRMWPHICPLQMSRPFLDARQSITIHRQEMGLLHVDQRLSVIAGFRGEYWLKALGQINKQLKAEGHQHLFFPHDRVLEDDHGFHVASSRESAMKLASRKPVAIEIFPEPVAFSPLNTETLQIVDCKRFIVPQEPEVLVRVLIPQIAIDSTHHCHVMAVMPPQQEERQEDIDRALVMCTNWLKRLAPSEGEISLPVAANRCDSPSPVLS